MVLSVVTTALKFGVVACGSDLPLSGTGTEILRWKRKNREVKQSGGRKDPVTVWSVQWEGDKVHEVKNWV